MAVVPFLAGLLSKTFFKLGCASVTVQGLPTLLKALENDQQRKRGRGIITVSNHISVLDDPFMWGMMPLRSFISHKTTRWTLGASDILFTNRFLSEFFRRGQVLELFRGKGIFQRAMDDSIHKLDRGEWIHIFSEGKVNQPKGGKSIEDHVLRFKWGVGRLCMEPKHIPLVIPIWITGLDNVMPEKRRFPRFIPRFRKHISITIGDPMDLHQRLHDVVSKKLETLEPRAWDQLENGDPCKLHAVGLREPPTHGGSGGMQSKDSPVEKVLAVKADDTPERAQMRSLLSACIREELVRVGEYREGQMRGIDP